MTARDIASYSAVAVVLGGGLRADGSPTGSTIRRADAAAELAKQRRDIALVVSGSHGNGPPPARTEAEIMAARIMAAGIDPDRIFVEDESRDTLSNAAFVAERYLSHIDPRPVVIVTSPFHLDRSLATFALVLGPSWPISGYASAPGENENAHAETEERYLRTTRARLDGLTPGDLPRIVERVRATLRQNVSDARP